jgi:hypothetical protein
MNSSIQENRIRVDHGVERERQIAEALTREGLKLRQSTADEDKDRKVDRWIIREDGTRVALQIKYRETGDDLLFEVFDRFESWDSPLNKIGRDMVGDAEMYAVLLQDKKTIVMVRTAHAKKIISELLEGAKRFGWTTQHGMSKSVKSFVNGHVVELKLQRDPRDLRQKMIAYIPSKIFTDSDQAQVYQVKLRKKW